VAIAPQTEQNWTVKNAPGVRIAVPSELTYDEEKDIFDDQLAALIAEHGSREAIPPGLYNSQIETPEIEEITSSWYPGKNIFQRGFPNLFSKLKTTRQGLPGATEESIQQRQKEIEEQARQQEIELGPRTTFEEVKERAMLSGAEDMADSWTFWTLQKLGILPDDADENLKLAIEQRKKEIPEIAARTMGDTLMSWGAQTAGESLPAMLPGIAGGYAAQKKIDTKWLKKVPFVGKRTDRTIKAGAYIIGHTLAQMPYFFGSHIERQMAEGADSPEDINSLKAAGAALGSSITDSIMFALLGNYGPAIQKTMASNIYNGIIRGVGISVLTEPPAEVIQAVLERAQAGLPISWEDEEAFREYIESYAGALFVGPLIGGPIGGYQGATEFRTGKAKAAFSDIINQDLYEPGGAIKPVPKWDGKFQGDPRFNMEEEETFNVDVPKGPIPFEPLEDAETKYKEEENTITIKPTDQVFKDKNSQQSFPFDELPPDSYVRLWFGALDENVNEETGELEATITPLIDDNGKEVYGNYRASEFIPVNPLTGEQDGNPSTSLLDKLVIEQDGVTYRAMWEDNANIKSFAKIPMGHHPSLRVKKGTLSPVSVSALFEPKIDPNAIPDQSTEEEYLKQLDAHQWIDYLKIRGKQWFVPQRAFQLSEWNVLNRQKWYDRAELRKAMDLNTRIERGIEKASKNLRKADKDVSGFKNLVRQELNNYWSGKEGSTKQSLETVLTNAGVNDVGEIVESAAELRRTVDENSDTILSLLDYIDPDMKKFPEKLRETIKERLGSYMTQPYAIYSDPQWQRPNRAPVSFLNPSGAQKWETRLHNDAVNWLANDLRSNFGYSVAESTIEAKNLLNKLYDKESSYQALGTIMQEPLVGMEDEISAQDKVAISPQEGVLMTKTKVPEAIKKVMGEITDPGTRMVLTAFRQGEFISGIVSLNELFSLANEPGNRWISKKKEARFNTRIEGSELNPFTGYYTTKPIADGLMEAVSTGLYGRVLGRTGDPNMDTIINNVYAPYFLRPKIKIAGGKILWSPSTQIRNVQSGAGFAIVNGHIDAIMSMKTVNAFRNAAQYLKGLTPAEVDKLVRLGVSNTSPMVGDLARMYEMSGTMDSIGGVIEMITERQRTYLTPFKGKAGEFVRKTYQLGDDFWKILVYAAEKQNFEKIFEVDSKLSKEEKDAVYEQHIKTMDDLMRGYPAADVITEGIRKAKFGKTKLHAATPEARYQQAIEELAAYRTRQNVPNYDFVGKFTDLLRAQVFVSNFSAFPTEQMRTTANVITSALNEIEVGKKTGNTKLQTKGYKKLFSFGAYKTAMTVMLPMTAAMRLGLKTAKAGAIPIGVPAATYALASFVPEWSEDDNRIITDVFPDGRVRWYNASYTDAYEMFDKPFRTTIRHVMDEKVKPGISTGARATEGFIKGLAEGIWEFFDPYKEKTIYWKMVDDVVNNYDSGRERKIWKSTDSLNEAVGKVFDHLLRSGGPGYISQGQRLYESFGAGVESYNVYGGKKSQKDAILKLLGLQVEEYNLADMWKGKILTEFFNERDQIIADFKAVQREQGGELLTTNDILKAYNIANKKYYELILKHRNIIQNANTANYYIDLEFLLDKTDKSRLNRFSKIDKANLGIWDESQTKFTPLAIKDIYTEIKEDAEDKLLEEGLRDLRLSAAEFPYGALEETYELYEKLDLQPYEWESPPKETD